ncbi:MAG: COX15/CtaA family protein [Planctomycetaceae bacterium]
MSSSSEQVDPIVHRFAAATCVVALLPIGIGTLVTTLRAGMAFADWPTSDGHNMLLYPWLSDLRNPDRFAEHGHRLAGMVIGFTSIALVAVAFLRERRSWVRMYSIVILVAVVAQGLLGGARVLLDANLLAMVHSLSGAIFFVLCVVFAMLTGSKWSAARADMFQCSAAAAAAVLLLPVFVLMQYWLGGMFRHMGRMMYEHLAGAVLVTLVALLASVLLMRSKSASLRSSGRLVLSALLIQLGLGVGAWLTKLNVPALGWVASTGSLASVVFRSAHTIGGMLLLTSSVLAAVHVARRLSWQAVTSPLNADRVGTKERLA